MEATGSVTKRSLQLVGLRELACEVRGEKQKDIRIAVEIRKCSVVGVRLEAPDASRDSVGGLNQLPNNVDFVGEIDLAGTEIFYRGLHVQEKGVWTRHWVECPILPSCPVH